MGDLHVKRSHLRQVEPLDIYRARLEANERAYRRRVRAQSIAEAVALVGVVAALTAGLVAAVLWIS